MVQLLKDSVRRISNRWFEQFRQPSISTPSWRLNIPDLKRAKFIWPTEYQWAPSATFLEPIRLGIAHWARLERRAIDQPYRGVCVFELKIDGCCHRVAIDYSDYADSLAYDCLATVSLYFKMQYREDGYRLSERDKAKVVPGGYVTADHRITPGLAAIRQAARRAPLQCNVYGRFSVDFAADIRTQVVGCLQSEPSLGYQGGLIKVPYRQSLMEAARAKICIDLPGNGDFCFRLLDYLAVGAFVIAYPHRTAMPIPLQDRHHLVYMKPDLSDLVELCHYYLDRPAERRQIQANATEYFDRRLHYVQLASWYAHRCLRMASEERERSAGDQPVRDRYRQSAA